MMPKMVERQSGAVLRLVGRCRSAGERLHRWALWIAGVVALGIATPAHALEKVTLQESWLAYGDFGGFYQASTSGIYAKYGLDVELRQGGPQLDASALLIAGQVDFILMSGLTSLTFVARDMPFLVVATTFQKDPLAFIAHQGVGNDSFADLKGKPMNIGATARSSFWPFLKAKFGYTDDQIRKYTFNYAPFLADKNAISQAYLTDLPSPKSLNGEKLNIFLLSDIGWPNYAEVIATSRALVDTKPDLVQRFVNASIEGWYSYLYGDQTAANARILKDNPDLTEDDLVRATKVMKEDGLVDSGDAKTLGIAAMNDQRWADLYRAMADAGIYPRDMDYKKAYTLQFVNKKVGMPQP